MHNKGKISILWLIICILGLTLGVFLSADNFPSNSPAECRLDGLLRFTFFLISCIFASLMELGTHRFLDGLRRVAKGGSISKTASKSSGWRFFNHAGWFFICLGCGLVISSMWMDSLR